MSVMHIKPHRTNLGPLFSEGARLLWEAIESRGWTQTKLRSELGIPAGMPATWLFGDRRPGRKWAVRLRDALNIPIDAWDEDPSGEFVPPAAREAA